MYASNLISDGSELLLLVPSMAGLVGSVVLPILGAVPDGAIVLFSGLGPNAAEELAVGIGALAGSTIMLLTIPWALSVFGGRVNINKITGKPKYSAPKLSPPDNMDLTYTGVHISPATNLGAQIMMGTAAAYCFIQVPSLGIMMLSEEKRGPATSAWALLTFTVCVACFFAYLWYQYKTNGGEDEERVIEDVMIEAINSGKITLKGIMYSEMKMGMTESGSYQSVAPSTTTVNEKSLARLKALLKPFYKKYDSDNSGTLDAHELSAVFHDLGENVPTSELMLLMDADRSGTVSYEEFVHGVFLYVMGSAKHRSQAQSSKDHELAMGALNNSGNSEHEGEEHEEEEEMPEDLSMLSPEEQQVRIKQRAATMLGLGTLIVLIVSDPMVAVLSEVGKRTGISPFYISFIFAPLASNASEVIASFNYSTKKTSQSISISLSALQGACIMNNSFVLAIFMLIIFAKGLTWNYFAETFAILMVISCVGLMGLKHSHNLKDALMILSLYPISLAVVVFLEAIGFD